MRERGGRRENDSCFFISHSLELHAFLDPGSMNRHYTVCIKKMEKITLPGYNPGSCYRIRMIFKSQEPPFYQK